MGEDWQARLLASGFVSFLDASAKCEKMVFFFDTDANGKLVDFPEPIDFPDTPYPIHPHVDCMDAGICEICGKETNVWTIIGEPREWRTVCLSCIAKDLLNAIRTYYQIKIISIEKMGAPYLKPYQWEKRLKKLLELLDKEGGQTFEEIKSKIGLGYGAVNWLSGHKKFGKYWYMGAATQIEANQLKGKRTLVFSITERGRRRLAFMKRVYGC